MTDKKPTDNEIIKALEFLLELVLVEGCLQRAKTIGKALDLIDRTKAREIHYRRKVQNQRETINALQGKINSLQAEIAELQKAFIDGECNSITAIRAKECWYRKNSEYIERLKAEIDRLYIALEETQKTAKYWKDKSIKKRTLWIQESGFDIEEIICKQLLNDETKEDIRTIVQYLFVDEHRHFYESEEPSDHIYHTLLRLKEACN
jgi:predicted RNase H-like nuclease (RuvC/YqgF family)